MKTPTARAVLSSGMSAISTAISPTYAKPVTSSCTAAALWSENLPKALLARTWPELGIQAVGFSNGVDGEGGSQGGEGRRCKGGCRSFWWKRRQSINSVIDLA